MPRKIVAGNWKMHGSLEQSESLLSALQAGVSRAGDVQLVVFPPHLYIPQTQSLLQHSSIAWGAQNVSEQPEGAYTGEVSVSMLSEFGCQFVIVGHSERRQLFAETDGIVANKVVAVAKSGLTPIFCVGETQAEREAGQTLAVIARQINALLQLENGLDSLYNGVIAYEPVWAIGTGLTATPEQAQDVHAAIRRQIAEQNRELAMGLSILYGGSVKRDNAQSLFAMPDINGGLIGGASLDAEHFLDIATLCNNY